MIWKIYEWKLIRTAKIKKLNEESLSDLHNNIKYTNICIIGVPEGEEREKVIENVFDKIMAENFLKLKKETDFQVQES